MAAGGNPFDVVDSFGLGFYDGVVVAEVLKWRQTGDPAALVNAQAALDRLVAAGQQQPIPAAGADAGGSVAPAWTGEGDSPIA